jgi:hypothetical protein
VVQKEEHSSKYNVKDAVAKLRTFKKKEELLAFTKGENRVTVTRVIETIVNGLEK